MLRGGLNRSNLLRLLAAVGLALVLWSWVTMRDDPEQSRTFSGIPVEIQGGTEGLAYFPDAETVQVTLEGPESVVDPIIATQITAIADVTEITSPGSYSVELKSEHPDNVWRDSVSPGTVQVVAEDLTNNSFELEIETTQPALASMSITDVRPETDTVEVSGRRSSVEQVATVALRVDAGQQVRTFVGDFPAVALDSSGSEIADVTINPDSVRAIVEMATSGKSVAVLVSTVGVPAAGFQVIDRTVNPATIVVDGPTEALAQLVAVRTEQVDLSDVNASFGASVAIDELPEGVSIVQPSSGMVDVYFEISQPGVRLELPAIPVTVVNVAPGMTAGLSQQTADLVVVAGSDTLTDADLETVRIEIDVAGLPAGTHQVQPLVVLPPQVQWVSTDPPEIEVTIQAVASPDAGTPPSG